jgi:hypothetical protein
MLTTAIPADIWTEHTVLIVHPGPKGDRGPSSLDWAIATGAREGRDRVAGGRGNGCGADLGVRAVRGARLRQE